MPASTSMRSESAATSVTTQVPTETATSVPEPTQSKGPAEELEAIVLATIPESAMRKENGFFGFEGVRAFLLDEIPYQAGGALWAAVTLGAPGDDSFVPHFVAVYMSRDTGWQEIDRIELPDAGQIFEYSALAVDVESSRYWVEIHAGVGAHGGYYELLSFDGKSLRSEVSGGSASPGAGETHDINGDGVLEVLINGSDPYVFCYACGVIEFHTDIYRWDGSRMVPVQLEMIFYDDDIPAADPVIASNAAVSLALANRWKEALALVDAHELLFEDDTIGWNAHYISENAHARLDNLEDGAFPFLQHIFSGDYAAAYEVLKQHSPQETFLAEPAFFEESPAEGFGDVVSAAVLQATDQARFSEPELASIIAVRAWALYLADPGDVHALEELEAALALASGDPYLAAAVEFLAGQFSGAG